MKKPYKKIEAYDKVLENLLMMRSVSEHLLESSDIDTASLMTFFFSASHKAIGDLKILSPENNSEYITFVKNK